MRSATTEKADSEKTREELSRLVDELGNTIQRTLSESPQIALWLNRIRGEGYDVSLALEATIGFSRSRRGRGDAEYDFRVEQTADVELQMTPLDKKFLRSLKIAVEEED